MKVEGILDVQQCQRPLEPQGEVLDYRSFEGQRSLGAKEGEELLVKFNRVRKIVGHLHVNQDGLRPARTENLVQSTMHSARKGSCKIIHFRTFMKEIGL